MTRPQKQHIIIIIISISISSSVNIIFKFQNLNNIFVFPGFFAHSSISLPDWRTACLPASLTDWLTNPDRTDNITNERNETIVSKREREKDNNNIETTNNHHVDWCVPGKKTEAKLFRKSKHSGKNYRIKFVQYVCVKLGIFDLIKHNQWGKRCEKKHLHLILDSFSRFWEKYSWKFLNESKPVFSVFSTWFEY